MTTTTTAPTTAAPAAVTTRPKVLRWEELTKTDFDRLDRSRCVVIVTCSPIEVHGPHLPLGTDAMEGDGLLDRLIAHLPERHHDRTFLKLPYIWMGADVLPQPGSLHFQPGTISTVLADLGRTLGAQGFKDVLVSNFHGSPRHFLAIEEGCVRGSRKGGARMFPIFSYLVTRLMAHGGASPVTLLAGIGGITKELLTGDAHGGLIETAQMLALRPDLVAKGYEALPRRTVGRHEERPAAAADEGRPLHGLGGVKNLGRFIEEAKKSIRFFERETYAGAPGAATPERGEKILDFFGGHAASAVADILEGKVRPEECHSPLWKLRFLLLNPTVTWIANRLLGYRPLAS